MKIKFVYSGVYDKRFKESPRLQRILKKQNRKYPPLNIIWRYLKEMKKRWPKYEEKILREISKLTKLKWQEKEVKCYIIGAGKSFSDPLTVRYFKNKNDFIDTLIHELIHQIQTQNRKKVKKWYDYIKKKYKKESILTQNHIIVHAVHYKLLENFFGKRRLNKQIKRHKEFPDYKRAWEIVEEETPKEIIKKFREFTK